MTSARRLSQLERARLDARRLLSARDLLRERVLGVREAHARYRDDGAVRTLHVAAQAYVDDLDALFGLPAKRVFMRDRPRPHKRRGGRIVYELHGLCHADGPIEVYTRTAAREQPVALLTLLDTLHHEWVHHFDFSAFRASVHCRGFYERLRQLHDPARDWLANGGRPRVPRG
ncbi:MAG: hypothetical protein H6825_03150 [Planctomycetes bacterium]|nr:hypothetical protein [Planctomycetota bacterium]